MPHREIVSAFLHRRGSRATCDACIGDHVALCVRQVGAAILALRQRAELRRIRGRCSGCCTQRTVSVLRCA